MKTIRLAAGLGFYGDSWEPVRASIERVSFSTRAGGGRVNFHTLRQQLLCEVHNPHAYFSPDVVLDLGEMRLTELGDDRVRVGGARRRPAAPTLKIVTGFEDGWMGHAVIGFCRPDALAKAKALVDSVKVHLAERRLA